MCYSRDWTSSEARKQQQKAQEAAQDKRSGVIKTLLSDAGKQADRSEPAKAPVKEAAPAK